MFRKAGDRQPSVEAVAERVDSVLGSGISWQGEISGTGGVRIDGAFDGEIGLRGLVVIGEQGRVTCQHIRAATVVVAGSVKGNITARKVEITRTGRVWGNVVTTSLSPRRGLPQGGDHEKSWISGWRRTRPKVKPRKRGKRARGSRPARGDR
jgi:cytoskeletal protein CcmA (bactofilin family)